MKPINEQERIRSFFIFIGFFFLTTSIAVGLVYFNAIFNPKLQNNILRNENTRIKKMVGGSQGYNKQIAFIDSLLGKVPEVNIESKGIMITKATQANEMLRGDLLKGVSEEDILNTIPTIFDKLIQSSTAVYMKDAEISRLQDDKARLKSYSDDLRESLKIKGYEVQPFK